MHRGFFLPVKAFPPAPNGPGTGGGRCHATYLCGERFNSRPPWGERPDGAYTGGTDARISIHALREEGDLPLYGTPASTLDFNPRPPRGGRLYNAVVNKFTYQISIHALREEGDGCAARVTDRQLNFNPRPPRGGRRLRCSCHRSSAEFQSAPSARRATVALLVPPIVS